MMMAIPEDKMKATLEAHPMKRIGEPEEIASVVAFLCTEDASWMTGQTVVVSGHAEVT